MIRLPGVSNWDVTLFKRVPLGNGRRFLQFRWEIYNLFNHTQFLGVDNGALRRRGQPGQCAIRSGD